MAIVRIEADTPTELYTLSKIPKSKSIRAYNVTTHHLRIASSEVGIHDDYLVLTPFKSATYDAGSNEAWVECSVNTVINVREVM